MSDNVAIVTGGAQGLGASITKVLLKRGYKVVVADVQEEKAKQFVQEQEKIYEAGSILFFLCDVSKLEDYKSLFEFALKIFKRVDLLVNNAGVICEQIPQKLININVMGPINGCQTALDYMGKGKGGLGGMVINTASIAGLVVHPAFPVYVASKHAVVGLTRSYGHSYYLEKEGIIFSAICPSYIATPLLDDLNKHSSIPNTDFKANPDLLNSDDVAQGINKLLDDKINGSTLVVAEGRFFYVEIQKELEDLHL